MELRGTGSGASDALTSPTEMRRQPPAAFSGNRSVGIGSSLLQAVRLIIVPISARRFTLSIFTCRMLPSLFMAKFRPVRAKKRSTPAPQGGMACVVLIILGMLFVIAFLFWVLSAH